MKVVIERARQIEVGIWQAPLKPIEVTSFGSVSSRLGLRSVIVIDGAVLFDDRNKTLAFEHAEARPLNVGESDDTLILVAANSTGQPKAILPNSLPSANVAISSTGDQRFLGELPKVLRELGETFLKEVRKHFRGSLRYYDKSGKYVETPDNFWTVRIQPRDESLRITLRGRPESFRATKLDLKADMTSYSAFKLASVSEISEAVSLIRQAAEK